MVVAVKILRQFRLGILGRRLAKTLDAIEGQMRLQNELLLRLANHFAPEIPAPPEDLARQTSVDFLNEAEAGRVVDYIDKTMRDTGRAPTEDEIIQYLADEATQSLIDHQKGQTL